MALLLRYIACFTHFIFWNNPIRIWSIPEGGELAWNNTCQAFVEHNSSNKHSNAVVDERIKIKIVLKKEC
jgi:hypothetical protein